MIAWEGCITFLVFFKMNNLSMIMRKPEETCMERYIPQNNWSDRFKGVSFMKRKEWLWNFHKLKGLRWHVVWNSRLDLGIGKGPKWKNWWNLNKAWSLVNSRVPVLVSKFWQIIPWWYKMLTLGETWCSIYKNSLISLQLFCNSKNISDKILIKN